MPTNYSGNTSGITGRPTVTVSNPVDGDAATAASNNAAAQTLANLVQYLCNKAGITDVASTWTAAQTVAANLAVSAGSFTIADPATTLLTTPLILRGATAETSPCLQTVVAPVTAGDHRKAIQAIGDTAGGNAGVNIYLNAALEVEFAFNATFDGTAWSRMVDADPAYLLVLGVGGLRLSGIAAGAGTFSTATFSPTADTLKFSPRKPANNASFTNALTPSNLPKAWGTVLTGPGVGPPASPRYYSGGFNLGSAPVHDGSTVKVFLNTSFPSQEDFAVFPSLVKTATDGEYVQWAHDGGSTSSFVLRVFDAAGAERPLATEAHAISFLVFGAQ